MQKSNIGPKVFGVANLCHSFFVLILPETFFRENLIEKM